MNFQSRPLPHIRSIAATAVFSILTILPEPSIALGQVRLEIVPIMEGEYNLNASEPRINNLGQVATTQGDSITIWQRDGLNQYLYALNHHSPVRVSETGSVTGLQGYWDYSGDTNAYLSKPPFVWTQATGFQYIQTEHLHPDAVDPWISSVDINNNDVVIGTSTNWNDNTNNVKAWIWTLADGVTEIPSLDQAYGYEKTQPRAINDNGVAVGDYAFDFSPSGSSYYRAFVYDEENGTRSLSSIDPSFFSQLHIEAHDINNNNVIAGTISSSSYFGFVYDLEKGSGTTFSGFGSGPAGPPDAVARSINKHGIAVGSAEDWERASPEDNITTPFLWSPEKGIVRLADFTTSPFESLEPAGTNIVQSDYKVSAINDHGQISGSVVYLTDSPPYSYTIPFVLYPTITYDFKLKKSVSRPEGEFLVFSHTKNLDEPSLSPEHFGKQIIFESSIDAETWLPLQNGINGVEIVDQEDELQIHLPEQPIQFIRSRMVDKTGDTN